MFDAYFSMFPFDQVNGEGFDLGCGSGRWAMLVAPKVRRLHCIDPAPEALATAKANMADASNVGFHLATADDIPLEDATQDFGYCLGVLHHVPHTAAALANATRKLKPGAPFLLYLYYALDDRPWWFRTIWKSTDAVRKLISHLPFKLKVVVTTLIAAGVYYPVARLSRFGGVNFPLSTYARSSFYTMRTDALDRFGTKLEQRFTKEQMRSMMESAGLSRIRFNDGMPKWVAIGWKR